MSPLLIAILGVLLVPLFVASWRLSLLALTGQGLIMAWISYRLDPSPDLFHASAQAWLELFDLVLVRGLGAPLALYSVLRARHAPARNDVLPPNLMAWTLAIALVLLSFRFAERMVPAETDEQTFVAVATAALLLGVLVLATQTGPFSQMVGVLRIENAIALFELGNLGGHNGQTAGALGLRLVQMAILVATILLFRWYLQMLPQAINPKFSAVEGPVR
jgi:hydrogenase-4 component E